MSPRSICIFLKRMGQTFREPAERFHYITLASKCLRDLDTRLNTAVLMHLQGGGWETSRTAPRYKDQAQLRSTGSPSLLPPWDPHHHYKAVYWEGSS